MTAGTTLEVTDAIATRVLVRLDAVSDHRAPISIAAQLASRWRTRLHGVFVEDEELIRLAELPFARQISVAGGPAVLDAASLGAQVHLFAAQARRQLAEAARHHGVDWSFTITPGLSRGPLQETEPGDFIVATAEARSLAGHARTASGRHPDFAAAGSTLLLRGKRRRTGPVIALVEPQMALPVGRLLQTAAELAAFRSCNLIVLQAAERRDEAGDWLEQGAPPGLPVRAEVLAADSGTLHRQLARLDCGVLATVGTRHRSGGDPWDYDHLVVR